MASELVDNTMKEFLRNGRSKSEGRARRRELRRGLHRDREAHRRWYAALPHRRTRPAPAQCLHLLTNAEGQRAPEQTTSNGSSTQPRTLETTSSLTTRYR